MSFSMVSVTVLLLPADLLLKLRAEKDEQPDETDGDPPGHDLPERPLTTAEQHAWQTLTATLQTDTE
ncbi:hypothetical protein ABZU25_28060 [Micromonospora sp. NPDC005215]|uniref:hypothetical protein n=1 Tax=Micromonospora sp. NPDC005215 TaxID=3157024 RepID=UPI0033BF76DA